MELNVSFNTLDNYRDKSIQCHPSCGGAGSSIPQRQNHMIRRDHLALPVFSCLRQMTK